MPESTRQPRQLNGRRVAWRGKVALWGERAVDVVIAILGLVAVLILWQFAFFR